MGDDNRDLYDTSVEIEEEDDKDEDPEEDD